MSALRFLRALGPIDLANVRRDPLLRWVALLPLLLALPARFAFPGMLESAGRALGLETAPHYVPLMGAALLLFSPSMVGMVVGFLLLDQRDDRTLTALRVTPLPPAVYVGYRLAAPVAVTLLLTAAALPLAGVGPLDPLGLLLVALAAAPLAPLYALVLAGFADNKVQGFALTKVLSVLPIAPLIAYFVGWPWQPLLALAPTYWPAQAYWRLLAGADDAWLFLLVGIAYQALLAGLLLRRFERVTAA